MARRKTHAEHVAEIAKINPSVEVLGKIINNATKVLCRCKTCHHEWEAAPSNLKSKKGCPECAKIKNANAHKLTHAEHVAEIAAKNPGVEIIGKITSAKDKVLTRCRTCGYEWNVAPCTLKKGHGCPKCAGRLTHAERVAIISEANPDVEILEEIKSVNKKVLCRCKVCGHEWMATPNNLKHGEGCPACGRVKTTNARRLTHAEQVEAIAKVNPDVEILGEITGNNVKVPCRCKICHHEWEAAPNTLKHGYGCPKCAGNTKKTAEEFIAEARAVHGYTYDYSKVKYVNNCTKVIIVCPIHGEFMQTPVAHTKNACGCPECRKIKMSKKFAFSHEKWVKKIAEKNPNIEILGEIVNGKTKVNCRCLICNHEWAAAPEKLTSGRGCPECKKVKVARSRKLPHEEHVAAIHKVNPNIEILGEIINHKTPVLCRCKICNHKWEATPDNLKHGYGCPRCAKYGFFSHDVGKLYIMVDDLNVPTMMKIGVSVQEGRRSREVLQSARRAGVTIPALHVAKTWEGPTELMMRIEQMMHENYEEWNIKFPTKFDGCTEFFYYTTETAAAFDVIEETLHEIINANQAA